MTQPARRYDCIVVGAGHNGLVCALYLARAGRSVLVLEAGEQVGGAAITREFAPGFQVSAGAHLLHLMPPRLMQELNLSAHGLKFAAERLKTVALAADGGHLTLAGDSVYGVPDLSDRAAYPRWRALMQRLANALHPALLDAPPRLGSGEWRDGASLLRLGWAVRRLGRHDMRELLRIAGMCVHDLLEEHFSSPLLRGALAFDAVLGSNLGPRSPGTVLSLLYRMAAPGGPEALTQPEGGLGAVTRALGRAATATGAELRTNAAVARIQMRADRVSGVTLASGEEIAAPVVISNADPRTTFLGLLGSEHLDAGFVRRIAQLRSRGLAAKVHLALDALPQLRDLDPEALRGRLLVAPSPDYVEDAYNHAKYREYSAAPALEVTVPTLADPALAPAGRHVMSVIAQYVPYDLAGCWPQQREGFIKRVIDTLAVYAPQLPASVCGSKLLTPVDIEREFRISGGHWHHAELAFDQFFLVRPVPGAAQYRTPVPGLFLCGAGCQPGGGVMGLAGRNAARQVMREAA
jgi:phytoene dehydrogenase-like protein